MFEEFDQQSNGICLYDVDNILSLYKKIPIPERFKCIDLGCYISSMRAYHCAIMKTLDRVSASSTDFSALYEFLEKLSVHIEALRVYEENNAECPNGYMLY